MAAKNLFTIITDSCKSCEAIEAGGIENAEITFNTPYGHLYCEYSLDNGSVYIKEMQLGEESLILTHEEQTTLELIVRSRCDQEWIQESMDAYNEMQKENKGCDDYHAAKDEL